MLAANPFGCPEWILVGQSGDQLVARVSTRVGRRECPSASGGRDGPSLPVPAAYLELLPDKAYSRRRVMPPAKSHRYDGEQSLRSSIIR